MRSAFFAALLGAATIVVLATVWLGSAPVRSEFVEPNVDVELVLAVDVSTSVNFEERRLQREGHVAALLDPETLATIQSGPLGRIAVSYMEWADDGVQWQLVGWTVLSDQASVVSFAHEIRTAPYKTGTRTGLTSALVKAAALIESNEYAGLRRVIDISGDGANNHGPASAPMRDQIVASGITINGLPIGEEARKAYEADVVGGPGSFMLPVEDHSGVAGAMVRKLRLEIG